MEPTPKQWRGRAFGTFLLVASCLGGALIALVGAGRAPTNASVSNGLPIPSLDSVEVKNALAQTQRVLDACLAKGWRYGRPPVESEELRLPGQINAEDSHLRAPGNVSFRVPFGEDGYDPEMAFFSETYVRRNLRRLKGEHTIATPEGFYIVAFRNGRVLTVPAEDAKQIPAPPDPQVPGMKRYLLVFPGMKHYDDPRATLAIPTSD